MASRACLKCGHVADGADVLDTCPSCGAVYAKVEAAFARGEPIRRVRPDTNVHINGRRAESVDERPGRLVSVVIALGFAVTTFFLLAGIAVFGMIMTAPGSDPGAAWSRGFEVFVRSLVAGWATGSTASLVLSFCRRPVAGLFAGIGLGLIAALVAGFLIP